ncbi:MAG: FAD:protein FMN transferase [Puniceicoccales bacterium]|jgi:thiamine biosynthesis lipoprotein|nr:FAD:protein FMN transferase [Puniceicoccales bacterium]
MNRSSDSTAKKSLRFTHEAMNTDFTIFIDAIDTDPETAAAAAQNAFAVLDRIESQMSRFVPSSDISLANTLPQGDSLQLNMEVFDCLSTAAALAAATDRAFDPAAGALIDFWKGAQSHLAATAFASNLSPPPEWEAAWEAHRQGEFALDPETRLLQCVSIGSKLDLGGIGKGFALDEMALVLEREWRISRALLSAGGSTMLALDSPLESAGWKIGFGGETKLPYLLLSRHALSSSGNQTQLTHIVDPRTGDVISRSDLIRALAPLAAEADALSTAFFVMSREELDSYCANHPEHAALLALNDDAGVPSRFDILGAAENFSWENSARNDP